MQVFEKGAICHDNMIAVQTRFEAAGSSGLTNGTGTQMQENGRKADAPIQPTTQTRLARRADELTELTGARLFQNASGDYGRNRQRWCC